MQFLKNLTKKKKKPLEDVYAFIILRHLGLKAD